MIEGGRRTSTIVCKTSVELLVVLKDVSKVPCTKFITLFIYTFKRKILTATNIQYCQNNLFKTLNIIIDKKN